MIEVENLSLSYQGEAVLKNLSFTIPKGCKAALAGPSGSGKSSILNILMGYVYGYDGRVRVDGLEVTSDHINTIRQRISWLPQELSFKVDLASELFYLPYAFRANRHLRPSMSSVEEVFGKLLLDPALLGKGLSEISGGQKQRIALASVLLLKRPMLLLDEPSSALDAESRGAIMSVVRGLNGVTVLAATHDAEWLDAADVVINLND